MPEKIPDGISKENIIDAIGDIDRGVEHRFSNSTGYDVLYAGRRYPPKAVIGLAASRVTGDTYGPYDFKGGIGSKCFRILTDNGMSIVTKGDTAPFPDELESREMYVEGATLRVSVNRYERDRNAREKCIAHHGSICAICGFNFTVAFGALGEGFIHVHHVVPLATIGATYQVDPEKDLVPVCPNCHAMLHKKNPPFSPEELRSIRSAAGTTRVVV